MLEHTGLSFWSQEHCWNTQAWLREARNNVGTHRPDFLKPGTKFEHTGLSFWSQEQSWNTQTWLFEARNIVGTHRSEFLKPGTMLEHTGLTSRSQEQCWNTQAWLSEVRNKVGTHRPDFLSQEQSWNIQACRVVCRMINKWETLRYLVRETCGSRKYFLRIDLLHVKEENYIITSPLNMTVFPPRRTCKDIKFTVGRWWMGRKFQRIVDLNLCRTETDWCMWLCIVFTKGSKCLMGQIWRVILWVIYKNAWNRKLSIFATQDTV